MATRKAKANYHNGTGFDTLHYETQAKQVKVLDGTGAVISDVDQALLKGKALTGINLNTILDTGLYRVKGGTNLPTGMDVAKTYIMFVTAIDNGAGTPLVHQEFYDHVNQNAFIRSLEGATIKTWSSAGKSTSDKISALETSLGLVTGLTTTFKTNVVGAINEVQNEVDAVVNDVEDIQQVLADLDSASSGHNHDLVYLKLTGGSLSGKTSMKNNTSYAGKNTGGTDINIGKVNATNEVILGESTVKAIIHSTGADLKVSDGTNSYKVFHAGNDGAGSGLDADKFDGLESNQVARLDVNNTYLGDQFIDNGKSIVIRAVNGSEQAGSIYFRNGANVQKAKIGVQADGDITITAGDVNGHIFRATGELYSTYNHILDASTREVRLQWKNSPTDQGMGFYFNNNTNQVGLWDWDAGASIFTTSRVDRTLKITNAPDIQGHKVSIQTTAPSNPATGDIWFDL